MKVYLVWAIDLPAQVDTVDRDSYIAQRPYAATYLPFWLFPDMKENTSKFTCEIVDLTGYKLGEDITYEAFLTMCNTIIAEERSGRCVILSVEQGAYLYNERYTPTGDEF